MEKTYNQIRDILILSILSLSLSCSNFQKKDLDDFSLSKIISSLEVERNFNVNEKCGFINNISVELPSGVIDIAIYVRCFYYKGDIISETRKKDYIFENKLFLSNDKVLVNNKEYSISEFENIVDKNALFNVNPYILIVVEDGENDNTITLMESLKSADVKNKLVFDYKNKQYEEDFSNNQPIPPSQNGEYMQ